MKLTGHRTEAIYRRYAIVSPSDLQAAAQRLADTIGDTGGPAAAAARLPLTDAAQPSRFMEHGRIAQRTERSPYKADVAGSNPAPPTIQLPAISCGFPR